jgi:hypothetical protein
VRRTILTATAVAAAVISLPGVASAGETTDVTPFDISASCSATMTTTFCEFQRGKGAVEIGAGTPNPAFGGTDHLLFDTPVFTDEDPATNENPGHSKATVFSYEFAGELLTDIDTLGYSSRVTRVSTANADQAPALNIEIDRNGGKLETGDYATLVWEPVYVDGESTEADVWLTRSPSTADGGWWSNANGTTTNVAGALGFPSYTADWAAVQNSPALAGATVLGIGVNQGGGNQGLASEVDLLRVNSTVYDFEAARTPVAKADCKGNNWTTFNEPTFRNQGECVSLLMSQRPGR